MRRAAVVAVLVSLVAAAAAALETDQYAAWGEELPDAAPMVNAWFLRELRVVVAEANRSGGRDCLWITRHYQRRLRYAFIFHPVEVWADTTGLIDRYPEGWEERDRFWQRSIYRDHGVFDVSLWMPLGPTVELGGIRIGTDKLAHFVSLGWQSFVRYRRLVEQGIAPRRAEERVIRWQVFGEKDLLLGYRTSGVLSISDLEADYRGMLFYRDLCSGPDPVLERAGGRWRIRRAIDIRRYVTPEWDESYEPQLFRPRRWRRIRPVLEGYCARLDDPWVTALRRRYRERDTLTPVERVVLELVERGKIRDPRMDTVDAVCGRPLRPWSFRDRPPPPPRSADPSTLGPLEEAIAREASSRPPRRFTLWRAGWYRPLGPSAGAALLVAPFRRGQHCIELCELDGSFLQLTAGRGGGGLSLGWAQFLGRLHRDDRTMAEASLAWGVKATVLRTWGDPVGQAGGATFAGPGFEFSIARVNLELQVLRRLDGPASGDWLTVWGLGFGF